LNLRSLVSSLDHPGVIVFLNSETHIHKSMAFSLVSQRLVTNINKALSKNDRSGFYEDFHFQLT
jgi:hypothetical protein